MAGIAVGVVLVVAVLGYWLTRPTFGEISPTGYDYAMALGSACSRRDSTKIAKITQMIDQSTQDGQLESQEAAWLKGIAQKAQEGHWEMAYASVRTLMQEQTQKSNPLPELD
ncbi:hypothetical protein C5Y96_13570 [Blastopirellula marina]|uniref:Uncharacterized protein n=1 Tax=Blastopirellula marina TaxID=124 RepID=A0A2S8FHI0_9BACT|nr:hypothetical protein C5Y96_13570 [Blastopirellula marina]RCS51758.1 hypothetical protein DTL36_13580 [Bremerella cremea]